MKYDYPKYVYETGSVKGYVGIEAPDKYVQKKFNYVQIIKDGVTYYLNQEVSLYRKLLQQILPMIRHTTLLC